MEALPADSQVGVGAPNVTSLHLMAIRTASVITITVIPMLEAEITPSFKMIRTLSVSTVGCGVTSAMGLHSLATILLDCALEVDITTIGVAAITLLDMAQGKRIGFGAINVSYFGMVEGGTVLPILAPPVAPIPIPVRAII